MSWHHPPEVYSPDPEHVTLFLAGAVITARDVDQILAYPRDPEISEIYLDSAGRVAGPG